MIKKYIKKKTQGKLSASIDSNNDLVISRKRYNEDTGEEVEPREDRFILKNLRKTRRELKQQLEDVRAMIAEYNEIEDETAEDLEIASDKI